MVAVPKNKQSHFIKYSLFSFFRFLSYTGENDQKCTRVFPIRRWVLLVAWARPSLRLLGRNGIFWIFDPLLKLSNQNSKFSDFGIESLTFLPIIIIILNL